MYNFAQGYYGLKVKTFMIVLTYAKVSMQYGLVFIPPLVQHANVTAHIAFRLVPQPKIQIERKIFSNVKIWTFFRSTNANKNNLQEASHAGEKKDPLLKKLIF